MTDLKDIRNKNISAAVSDREKKAFQLYCAERKIKPSQMLRLMLHKVCPDDIDPGERPGKEIKGDRLMIRLSQSDLQMIKEMAKSELVTSQEWIRRRISAVLHKTHQFNKQEENALRESNRELSNLVRQIKQINEHLNSQNPASNDQISAELLTTLEADIQNHKSTVAKLLNANWGRFGDGDPKVRL